MSLISKSSNEKLHAINLHPLYGTVGIFPDQSTESCFCILKSGHVLSECSCYLGFKRIISCFKFNNYQQSDKDQIKLVSVYSRGMV